MTRLILSGLNGLTVSLLLAHGKIRFSHDDVHILNSCIPDEKYKLIQDFGQGQKYWSDLVILTLLF